MLAQVTLDLGTIVTGFKYLLAAGLLAIAVITFLIPLVRDLLTPAPVETKPARPLPVSTATKRKDIERCSDTPPPEGFAEHLQIIETSAPNATPDIWWAYAKSEMTQAEVALAEAKLARQCPEVK